MTRADHVADDRAGDDDVGPAHAAADDAALADDDGRLRLDRAFDRAVDAKRALGAQIAAHGTRPAQHVLDRVFCRSTAALRF